MIRKPLDDGGSRIIVVAIALGIGFVCGGNFVRRLGEELLERRTGDDGL